MYSDETNYDLQALALSALGWILSDGNRAERLLGITGLTPEAIRQRIEDPQLLAAIIRFLEAYEPDLISCGKALNVAPEKLIEARRHLEQG